MIAKVRSRAKILPPNRLVRTKGPPSKEGGYNITGARQASPLQTLAQCGGDGGAEIGRRFDAANPGGAHRGVLVFRRALSAADDPTGVAHAASRRGGLTTEQADHPLPHIPPDSFPRPLLRH